MKVEYTIPEDWSEIKYIDYIKFYQAVKPYENTEEYVEKCLERAAYYFCGIDSDVYKQLPVENFSEISQQILNLIDSSKNHKLIQSFNLLDVDYGFIPSLDDMTYGEYIDLITYSKETWENMPLLMSILYRPITDKSKDKYKIQTYNGTVDSQVELFKSKMTMDIVFGALSFFLRLQLDLLNATLTYSMENLTKKTDEQTSQAHQILAKNGVSMQHLQRLQTTMLETLTK
jgi:hypothetical protein